MDDPDDRRDALNGVLLKAGALLLGIAVVVAAGTYVVVHALGLNSAGDSGSVARVDTEPYTPLPSTALPLPHQKQDQDQQDQESPDAGDRDDTAPGATKPGGDQKRRNAAFQLAASPQQVAPMQRINLTGTYRGEDNVQLQVQRLEHGRWADFPTQVTVRMGTFQTYVMTGHTGVNKFRVYDPNQDRASNIVEVQVG